MKHKQILSLVLVGFLALSVPIFAQGVPDSPKKAVALSELRVAGYNFYRAEVSIGDIFRLQVQDAVVEDRAGLSMFQVARVWNNLNIASSILTGVAPNPPEMPATVGVYDVVTQPIEASCLVILDSADDFEGAIYELSNISVLHTSNAAYQNKVRVAINHIATAWAASDRAARAIFEIPLQIPTE